MNSGPWPRVSIITPSFNQARFIEETILSVVNQEYPNLEYIVIDGGSTDGSVDIIRRHQKHLAYWVSERDNGAADAIRKGFEMATGDIFAYLNSDDPYLPNTLSTIAREMDDSADVVYGDTFWIDSSGEVIGQRRQTPFDTMGYLYGGYDLQQPSTFWRRQTYLGSGGIDPGYHFAFDADLFMRFAASGARFKHVKQFLSSYRIHEESKSTRDSDVCARELEMIRKKYLRFSIGSLPAKWYRNMARVHRAFWYLRQGDGAWMMQRIPDRLSAHRSAVTVGPKARRL